MGKLAELREFVKQQFEQADTNDKTTIDLLAKINSGLDDAEKEQNSIEAKNAELVKSYKDLVKHTSFGDVRKQPTDPVGGTKDINAKLDDVIRQNIEKFKKN